MLCRLHVLCRVQADTNASSQEALVIGREGAGNVDGLITILAEKSSILHTENESCFVLADIATGELGCFAVEREATVFSSKFVGSVDFHVAFGAECRLVSAADHRRRRRSARIAANLHISDALSFSFQGNIIKDFRTKNSNFCKLMG